jgi:hypothetical protein
MVISVVGIVATGCKAVRKPGDNGKDRVWFSRPAEKVPGKDGEDKWRGIVTAAEPVMRHLQGMVLPQSRALLNGSAAGSQPRQFESTRRADRRPRQRTIFHSILI